MREEDQCSEPGPWSNDRTPHLVGLMDCCVIGGFVRTLVIKKAARMGVSEGCIRNVMGYREDTKPGPSMLVNATQKKTEEVLDRQLKTLFEHTPRLSRHLIKISGNSIKLTKTVIDLGWPNSPITMADRSVRDIYGDEYGKWPRFAKQEASPGPLLDVRRDTYYDQSIMVLLSSPTHSAGPVSVDYDACPDRVHGEVPCPKCGKYQPYDFWNGVKWNKLEGITDNRHKASRILEEGLAYYQCKYCSEKWKDSEKDAISLKMVYVFDGDAVNDDIIKKEHQELEKSMGRKVNRLYNRVIWNGRKPSELGVQLSGLFSPWRSYSRFLSEMYKCIGHPGKMQNFRNSWLGEDYEYMADKIDAEEFDKKIGKSGKRYACPHWATCLIATADTQQTSFFYTVRAWGPGYRSQLVDHGQVDSFKALRERTIDKEFVVDREGWGTVTPVKLFIDAGGGAIKGLNTTRTWQVYQFALADPGRIMPVRGHGGAYQMESSLQKRTIDYTPPGEFQEKVHVTYLRIETGCYKDLLSSRVKSGFEKDDYWGLHDEKDPDYLSQISSEHKVLEGQGDKQHFVWKTKTSGAANHFWDCENYQMAAAEFIRVTATPSIEEIMKNTEENESYHKKTYNEDSEPEKRRW